MPPETRWGPIRVTAPVVPVLEVEPAVDEAGVDVLDELPQATASNATGTISKAGNRKTSLLSENRPGL